MNQSLLTPPSETAPFETPGREFSIPKEALTERQQALVKRMEAGPRGKVPINQRLWMHNIEFAEVAERFGAYVSAEAPIDPRSKEICILVVAAYWDSAFEWHWHEALAHKKGISQDQTDAIRTGRNPGFENPVEQTTFEVATALLRERDVPDELFQKAGTVLGRQSVLDLIGLMGLYSMIAHTVMMYRVQIPA